MSEIQPITYRGQLGAVVIGDQATIVEDGRLSDEDLVDVQAMCLYAMEVDAGRHPGPYSDEGALAYARQAKEGRQRR